MDAASDLPHNLRAFSTITTAITTSASLRDVLAGLLEGMVTELAYMAATLHLLDEERQILILKAVYGLSLACFQQGAVAVAENGIDRTVLSGTPMALSDARHDSSFQDTAAATRVGVGSMLAVPLLLRTRVSGILRVYTPAPHTFGAEERAIVAAIANLGAKAIERTRRHDAFQAISRDVNASLVLKDVLTMLLVDSVSALNVKAGSIHLLGPQRATLHLVAASGLSASYLQSGTVIVAHSRIDAQVLAEGQAFAMTEVSHSTGFEYPEEAQREGIRSLLVLPLSVQDTSIGVLHLYSGRLRRFSAEEIGFGMAVAGLGAVAIENARLHETLKARLEALKEDSNGWYRTLAYS